MSIMGRVHGSIFSSNVPGRNPISSSTDTTGRVITILLYVRSLYPCIAAQHASIVFPVPAGPTANTMGLLYCITLGYILSDYHSLESRLDSLPRVPFLPRNSQYHTMMRVKILGDDPFYLPYILRRTFIDPPYKTP